MRENGEPQVLDLMMQSREPALFALLVDSQPEHGHSIRCGPSGRGQADRAAGQGRARSSWRPFSRTIGSVTGPTTDRQTVLDAIRGIRHSGGTAILDALGEAARAFATMPRRKAIVLITDGYDEHSESKFEQATETLQNRWHHDLRHRVRRHRGHLAQRREAALASGRARPAGAPGFLETNASSSRPTMRLPPKSGTGICSPTPRTIRRATARGAAIEVSIPGSSFRVIARKGYTAPIAPPVRASLEFTAVGTGQTAPLITRDDIVVLEDGVPQEVDMFQEAVLPVTFMLALDSSGSMKRSAAQAQEAAREFIVAMRPEDPLGMILFGSKVEPRSHADRAPGLLTQGHRGVRRRRRHGALRRAV